MFIECGYGKYSEFGYEPCIPCPEDTYQDTNGATYCIPFPCGGQIWVRGANSSEQCRVYFGNFDVNHPNRNLNGLSNTDVWQLSDRVPCNGTLVGWDVELTGYGNARLYIYRKNIPSTKIE